MTKKETRKHQLPKPETEIPQLTMRSWALAIAAEKGKRRGCGQSSHES